MNNELDNFWASWLRPVVGVFWALLGIALTLGLTRYVVNANHDHRRIPLSKSGYAVVAIILLVLFFLYVAIQLVHTDPQDPTNITQVRRARAQRNIALMVAFADAIAIILIWEHYRPHVDRNGTLASLAVAVGITLYIAVVVLLTWPNCQQITNPAVPAPAVPVTTVTVNTPPAPAGTATVVVATPAPAAPATTGHNP